MPMIVAKITMPRSSITRRTPHRMCGSCGPADVRVGLLAAPAHLLLSCEPSVARTRATTATEQEPHPEWWVSTAIGAPAPRQQTTGSGASVEDDVSSTARVRNARDTTDTTLPRGRSLRSALGVGLRHRAVSPRVADRCSRVNAPRMLGGSAPLGLSWEIIGARHMFDSRLRSSRSGTGAAPHPRRGGGMERPDPGAPVHLHNRPEEEAR
jgi:hypothetical protein